MLAGPNTGRGFDRREGVTWAKSTIKPRVHQRQPHTDRFRLRKRFDIDDFQASLCADLGGNTIGYTYGITNANVYIKPNAPRLNGKVERSHRIDGEEFYRLLDGIVIDDAKVFNAKLKEWEDFYNYNRPHGSLGGQTPYETTSEDPDPELPPVIRTPRMAPNERRKGVLDAKGTPTGVPTQGCAARA